MSHYTVAVITDEFTSVDSLLERFDENIEVEPYIRRTKEEIISDKKDEIDRIRKLIKKHSEGTYKGRCYWLTDENVNPRNLLPYYMELLSLENKSDEEIYQASIYEDAKYDEDGNELSTYNPDSKWDWYEVGGRWSGLLKKKDGTFCDKCKISEIDFKPIEADVNFAKRWWEVVIDGEPLKEGESKDDFKLGFLQSKESIREKYKDKETYAIGTNSFHTWAVLTPEGEWNEPGAMGWWAISDASPDDELSWQLNYYDNFIKPYLDGNYTITIVDCHI